MLRRLAVSAFGASALALAVSTPVSALPTGTWTLTGVSVGSTLTATSTNVTFWINSSPASSCSLSTATGTVANTSGDWETPPPNTGDAVIGSLAVTTSGCVPSFALSQNGTAEFYVTGPTSGAVTPGEIRGLSVKAENSFCRVQVDGLGGANSGTGIVEGSYDNNAGTITVTTVGNLRIASVALFCSLGGIKVGDSAALSGTFTVTSTPPTITATL
jgi:hypothetical protein